MVEQAQVLEAAGVLQPEADAVADAGVDQQAVEVFLLEAGVGSAS
jgi:hypothetical protein